MPQLTVALPKGQGSTGQTAGRDPATSWMEEVKEDLMREQSSRARFPAEAPQRYSSLSQAVRSLQPWSSLAPVGVVWSVCQLEALLSPSLSLVDVSLRLLLVVLLWVVLGVGIHVLKCSLRPEQEQAASPLKMQQEVVTQNRNDQHGWTSVSRSPGVSDPLSVALADCLLLCVLQEPLPLPNGPHIQALSSRLESVARSLEGLGVGECETLQGVEQVTLLTDKLELLHTYLQQRIASLHAVVRVQGDFEASVKAMLQGLDGLWAQLEELHTGVTLTKEGSKEQVAVSSAQTDAESLFATLNLYRTKMKTCRSHLKDSTQLLQELTWSHSHISHRVNSSSESVWPELLLQANMEQFDKVQECFLAVEQQTSTFQAHLQGLGQTHPEGSVGPLSQAKVTRSCSVPTHTSLPHHNGHSDGLLLERSNSISASTNAEESPGRNSSPLLCGRSALQFSSTFQRLRRSGRKK